ncbi:MAG: hypothetical protein JSS53_03100 [Proteobacteria bacterium]|nr:hypothetical protein [Pseudomonadota bacterium]
MPNSEGTKSTAESTAIGATGTGTAATSMSFEEKLLQEMQAFRNSSDEEGFKARIASEKFGRLFDDLLRQSNWNDYPILERYFRTLLEQSFQTAIDQGTLFDFWLQLGIAAHDFLFKSDGSYRDFLTKPVEVSVAEKQIAISEVSNAKDKPAVFYALVKAWAFAYMKDYFDGQDELTKNQYGQIRTEGMDVPLPPDIPDPKATAEKTLDVKVFEESIAAYQIQLKKYRQDISEGGLYTLNYYYEYVFKGKDPLDSEVVLFGKFFEATQQASQLASGLSTDFVGYKDALAALEFFWAHPEIGRFLFIAPPTEDDWEWARIAKEHQNTTNNTTLANLVRQHATSKELAEFARTLEFDSFSEVYRSAVRRFINESTKDGQVIEGASKQDVSQWSKQEIEIFVRKPSFNETFLADQARKLLPDDELARKAKQLIRKYTGKLEEYRGREAVLPYMQQKIEAFKTENQQKIEARAIALIKQQLEFPVSHLVQNVFEQVSSTPLSSNTNANAGLPLPQSLRSAKEVGLRNFESVLGNLRNVALDGSNQVSPTGPTEEKLPEEIEALRLINSLESSDGGREGYWRVVRLVFERTENKKALAARIEDFSHTSISGLSKRAQKKVTEEVQAIKDSITELQEFEKTYRAQLQRNFDLLTTKTISSAHLARSFNAQVKEKISSVNTGDFSAAYDSLARLTYLEQNKSLPSAEDLNNFKAEKNKYLEMKFSSMVFEKYKELEVAQAKESIAAAKLELESASSQLEMDLTKFGMIKANVATQINSEETRVRYLEDTALQYKLAAEVLSFITGELTVDKTGFDAIAQALLKSPVFHQQFDPIFSALLRVSEKRDIAAQLKNHQAAEEFFIMVRQLLFRQVVKVEGDNRVTVIHLQPWAEMLLGQGFGKGDLVSGVTAEQAAKKEGEFQQLFVSVFQACVNSLSEQPEAKGYATPTPIFSIPLDVSRKQLKPVLEGKETFNLVNPTSKRPQLPTLVLKRTQELVKDMIFFTQNLRGLEVDLLKLREALIKEDLRASGKLKKLEEELRNLPVDHAEAKEKLTVQINTLEKQAQRFAENRALVTNLVMEVHSIKQEFDTAKTVYEKNILAVRRQTSDLQTQAQEIEQVNITTRGHITEYIDRIEKVRDQFVNQLKRETQISAENSEQKESSPAQVEQLKLSSRILDWFKSLLSTKYYVREHTPEAVSHAFKGFMMKTGGVVKKEEKQELTGAKPQFGPKVGGPK